MSNLFSHRNSLNPSLSIGLPFSSFLEKNSEKPLEFSLKVGKLSALKENFPNQSIKTMNAPSAPEMSTVPMTSSPKNSGELVSLYRNLGFEVEVEHSRYSNADFNEMQKLVRLIEKAGGRVTKAVELDILENYNYAINTDSKNFAPRGGRTVVTLKKNNIIGFGFSRCSIGDNFSRFEGVERAIERAAEDYQGLEEILLGQGANSIGGDTKENNKENQEPSGGMASEI